MADNASIARPYAKALFDLAQEAKAFDSWSAALKKLAAIATDDQFSGLINDPKVSPEQLSELLHDLSKDVLPQGGDNFVNLLIKNNRTAALPDILAQYQSLVAKAQANINAEVVTAKALTAKQKSALESALQQRLGLKVSINETVDADLIGGAIVKAGDLVIDGSAKGRLEKLSTALMR